MTMSSRLENKAVKGPIILWRDFGYEGWQPTSYATLDDAINGGLTQGHYLDWVMTKVVQFEVREKQ